MSPTRASGASDLKPYMAHMGEPWDCASLIFAHNAREAKKLARRVSWMDCAYTDIRVNLIRDGDGAKFRKSDQPHVIESPPVCARCEQWKISGYDESTGLCDDCFDDDEAWDE